MSSGAVNRSEAAEALLLPLKCEAKFIENSVAASMAFQVKLLIELLRLEKDIINIIFHIIV